MVPILPDILRISPDGEAIQSHEDLPESPDEGDAYLILGGKWADVAYAAICEPGFRGWVPLGFDVRAATSARLTGEYDS